MRIIFHIGMGKTGTTSIQNALAQNAAALARQKARYLGMWFDGVDQKFRGLKGFGTFVAQSAENQKRHAQSFLDYVNAIEKDTKATTFVFSNESLFQNGPRLTPFFGELQNLSAELEVIAYVRDPRAWLPSAHTQWALRHKTNEGPLEDLATSARRLIKFYDALPFWIEQFGDAAQIRHTALEHDVVADFAETTGLILTPPATRALERSEPADILLRAMFNNRVEGTALPERFNRVIRDTEANPVPSLEDIKRVCFDQSAAETVIAENADMFEFLRDRTGIDFVNTSDDPPAEPDDAELQRRVIDYLIEITFDQAQRLKRLERLVSELQKD